MRYLACLLLVIVVNDSYADRDLFGQQIRSLLAEKCFACHGPDVQEADLRLDTRQHAIQALDSGTQAIVPGDPDASELIHRVSSDDSDLRMPPEGDALSADQIRALKTWIKSGGEYTQHWAYREIDPGTVPDVRPEWVNNPIDQYVLAELQEHNITPSPTADRYTLIKRVYYDLVGLPPSLDEVDAFVNDTSGDAYERLIDALLESEHFGERWGRHWLDKARYADSDGYEKDRPRLNAWKYRDWVINAINKDLPIDQFTTEQLAGDLLPDSTDQQRLATAFHRQTLTNTEGGVDQEEFRVEAVFDRTETTGAIWLGLTVGCARCHSHKYDAISQDEYYRLFAFFNNGDESNLKLPKSAAEMTAYVERKTEHDKALKQLNQQLSQAKQEWEQPYATWQTELKQKLDELKPLVLHDIKANAISASVDGINFVKQKDSSFLVSGKNPDGPVEYTLGSDVSVDQPITGIRIDALKDASLPKKGPGRVAHGNFVLSEVAVTVNGKPAALTGGNASFAQQNWPAKNAIDGKLDSGWAISPKLGQDHHVQFKLKTETRLDPQSKLQIQLKQHYGSQHALGRFRVRLITGVSNADDLAPEAIRKIALLDKRSKKQEQQLVDHFLRHHFATTKAVYDKLDAHKKKAPVEPLLSVRVITQRGTPRDTKVFDRGSFLSPTHSVSAGGLSALPSIQGRAEGKRDRLDFANWLMDPGNPLPPRVLANHLWTHLFGQGLVRTVNDFGVRGEPPTHPRLLDWLANEYRRVGWSRKQMIKTIMMSATYQQASHHRAELLEVDAENRLLARQNRVRVPAEIVRDLCLSVSGLMSDKVGGPSVFPPLPADVASLSYANNFKWNTSKGEDRYRRGMYTFFKRTSPHPNLTVFDCPDSNTTNLSRRISNTPLQALAVLNNEVYHEAAQALAGRVLAEDSDNDLQRINMMLRFCVARSPTKTETSEFVDLLKTSRSWYSEHLEQAAQMTSKHQNDKTPPAESAAWIAVARIALNLDEFVTRE